MNVGELLQSQMMSSATLVAGERGLEREVTWCAPDSNLAFSNFVMPGLMMLHTGRELALSRDALQEKLVEVSASSVVTFKPNEGMVPSDLNPQFFHDYDIPLIALPHKASVMSFSRHFVSALVAQETEKIRCEDCLRALCSREPSQAERSVAIDLGYRSEMHYCCVYLVLEDCIYTDAIQSEFNTNIADNAIRRAFAASSAKALTLMDGNTVVAFVPWSSGTDGICDFRKQMRAICSSVQHSLGNVSCHMYVGNLVQGMRHFHESYANAIRAKEIVSLFGVHDRVTFFDDWYMHMLLLKEPHEELRDHMRRSLEPILEAPELLETLTNYLVFGENLKLTAEKTFIHINTLKYRLKRIQELLGVDLHDPNVRFRLRMAVTIERYLRE